MPSVNSVALHLFLQLAVILAVYALLTPVFRRLGQGQTVAIMVTGLLLGPSLLGVISPSLQEWLFPSNISTAGVTSTHPSLVALYVVGQLGLVSFMFLVGTTFNVSTFARHIRYAPVTSLAGIAAPMALGGFTGLLLVSQQGFFGESVRPWQAALFVAAAVAITAIPMLAPVLLVAVASTAKGDITVAVMAAAGGLVYLAVMVTAGRRALRRLGRWAQARAAADGAALQPAALIVVTAVLMLAAWATDLVGGYAVCGAFVAGAVMPRGYFVNTVRNRLEPLTAYLLLPAFFVHSGLNTELSLVFEPTTSIMLGVVLVVSFVGRGLSIALTAPTRGLDWQRAGAAGVLPNARGLVVLILLNIGLNAGLVGPTVYTILAIMAIVTTFAARPLYHRIQSLRRTPKAGTQIPAGEDLIVQGQPGPTKGGWSESLV
jgi:Kef-type K+ transport system membrane component KefB